MHKILIVEDDVNLVTTVAGALEMNGYQVRFLTGSSRLHETIKDFSPDIILMDVMLNETSDGFELVAQIRDYSNVPVIFTTSRQENADFASGFSFPETDYIRKPYKLMELLLRIKNILQRTASQKQDEPVHVGSFWFYPEERTLKIECDHIRLNNMETAVLSMLCKSFDQYVSREEIVREVWGEDDLKLKEASLNNTISRLRSYLKKDNKISIESRNSLGVKLSVSTSNS